MPADGLTTGRANGVFAVRGLSPRSPESNCKLLRTPTVTQSHGNPTVTRRAGVRSGLLCSPPSELLGRAPPIYKKHSAMCRARAAGRGPRVYPRSHAR